MKTSKLFLIGMAALALIFGLLPAGCDTGVNSPPPGDTPVTYTVSFDAGSGGSGAPASIENVAGNALIAEPAATPTRSNYCFDGWYKEEAGTNLWNFAQDRVNGTITLHAKWRTYAQAIQAKWYNTQAQAEAQGTTSSAGLRIDYRSGGNFVPSFGAAATYTLSGDTLTVNFPAGSVGSSPPPAHTETATISIVRTTMTLSNVAGGTDLTSFLGPFYKKR